uniref:54 kDa protein n=1 Tax=Beet necrotic yellow vein virus TaxID=31721 RepID=Q86971_9VIRU|nr:54 kDa protein [Beet necrotic yellow vein virus]
MQLAAARVTAHIRAAKRALLYPGDSPEWVGWKHFYPPPPYDVYDVPPLDIINAKLAADDIGGLVTPTPASSHGLPFEVSEEVEQANRNSLWLTVGLLLAALAVGIGVAAYHRKKLQSRLRELKLLWSSTGGSGGGGGFDTELYTRATDTVSLGTTLSEHVASAPSGLRHRPAATDSGPHEALPFEVWVFHNLAVVYDSIGMSDLFYTVREFVGVFNGEFEGLIELLESPDDDDGVYTNAPRDTAIDAYESQENYDRIDIETVLLERRINLKKLLLEEAELERRERDMTMIADEEQRTLLHRLESSRVEATHAVAKAEADARAAVAMAALASKEANDYDSKMAFDRSCKEQELRLRELEVNSMPSKTERYVHTGIQGGAQLAGAMAVGAMLRRGAGSSSQTVSSGANIGSRSQSSTRGRSASQPLSSVGGSTRGVNNNISDTNLVRAGNSAAVSAGRSTNSGNSNFWSKLRVGEGWSKYSVERAATRAQRAIVLPAPPSAPAG